MTTLDTKLPEGTKALPAWRRVVANPIVIASVATILLVAIGNIVSPGFGSSGQIISMLRVSAFLGVIAVGQTFVILSGGEGIDLSVGKVATLGAIIASRVMNGENSGLVKGVVVAIVVCAILGLINGLGATYLRIPPFVMTLGMAGVAHGIILAYTGGTAAGRSAPILTSLVNGKVFLNIPGVLFLWLVIGIVVSWILHQTTYGWRLYAVGTQRNVSALSGVPVRRTVILAYMTSSIFAAVGGILLLGYTESVFLDLADSYTMASVAAVVIGGTLIAGGYGGYVGSAVGAMVLTALTSLLTTMEMGQAWRTIINGLVLIILLSLYGRQKRLRS